MDSIEITADDLRHAAEIGTDAAAAMFGLQALGFTPIQDLGAINPTDPIFGIVAILAVLSFVGTLEMMQEERF